MLEEYIQSIQRGGITPAVQLELDFTNPDNFAKYSRGHIDGPFCKRMQYLEFKGTITGKLVKQAESLGIFRDQLPKCEPIDHLEINFEHTKWKGAYGHPVQPEFMVKSPSIAINRNGPGNALYTLIMTDLGIFVLN